MSLTLHKVTCPSDDPDDVETGHVFTFVWDDVTKLNHVTSSAAVRSVESSEVKYAGHVWNVVATTRKDADYLGLFLKWRCVDGASVSVKVKYSLTLIHRHDYTASRQFSTTQKFTSTQSMLGKTRFISLSELTDVGSGFLSDSARNVIIELQLNNAITYFEKSVDISPSSRTRKNASGVYFDTTMFQLADHRWYVRFYVNKLNSGGLPAVYLYLSGKTTAVSVELQFTLRLDSDVTEILTYSFGDSAKYDGFGKTLGAPLHNVDRLNEMTVAVEIQSVVIYKVAPVRLPRGIRSQHRPSYYPSSAVGVATVGLSSTTDSFQDHEGNSWKTEILADHKQLTISVDKSLYHYQHNRTKILIVTAILLSRDHQRAPDVAMKGHPVHGYFSNFIDDKGYLMTFPLQLAHLSEDDNAYVDQRPTQVVLTRINIISLQTTPLAMRSSPRFDYQVKHLQQAREELGRRGGQSSLESSRDMSASRASLSILDDADDNDASLRHQPGDDAVIDDDDKYARRHHQQQLVAIDNSRVLVASLLRHMASLSSSSTAASLVQKDDRAMTLCHNDAAMSSQSGCSRTSSSSSSSLERHTTSSADSGLAMHCTSLPVISDVINVTSDDDYTAFVSAIVSYIKSRLVTTLRITGITEAGSVGTATVTPSRTDLDLIISSPDIPRDRYGAWVPALLHAVLAVLQQPSAHAAMGGASPAVGGVSELPGACTDWHVTFYSVHFQCADVDVDIFLTSDWSTTDADSAYPRYDALYDVTCQQTTHADRYWFSFGAAQLQKRFVADQPKEVRGAICLVKHWCNTVQWRQSTHRPNSYLLSLLVIKAAQHTRSSDVKRILQQMGSYVTAHELRLQWSTFYCVDDYDVEFDPPSPLVRDPANPGVNVAASLAYWGQLRTEFTHWLRTLNITLLTSC